MFQSLLFFLDCSKKQSRIHLECRKAIAESFNFQQENLIVLIIW